MSGTDRESARADRAGRPAASAQRPADRGASEDPVSLIGAVPGLARLAFTAYWNTAGWAAGTTVRVGSRVVRAAASGENPAVLASEAAGELRGGARKLLGIEEDRQAPPITPTPDAEAVAEHDDENAELKLRGAELLRRSAEVSERDDDAGAHPAYERILDDIAPDEARILRLLATKGPQPAVDVRTWRPLGVGSTLVAAGISMIAAEAGLLHPERIHPHLDNLARLGLVWFPHEPLSDPRVYQVLEAQPEVGEALERAGRGRTDRRAIALTSFGTDFCRAALPLAPLEPQTLRPVDGESEPEPDRHDAFGEAASAGETTAPESGPGIARDTSSGRRAHPSGA